MGDMALLRPGRGTHLALSCVLMAPFMASNTSVVAFLLARDLQDSGAGLLAALLVAVVPGRSSPRLYASYSVFYVLGTLLSMQVHFVGFQGVQSGEHMLAAVTFVVLQIWAVMGFYRSKVPEEAFFRIKFSVVSAFFVALTSMAVLGYCTGFITPWADRLWMLIDPQYSKNHSPITSSVTDHQPSTWSSLFLELHLTLFLMPVGIYLCFALGDGPSQAMTESSVFIVLYGVTALYFASVLMEVILVLAPAACVLAALGLSHLLRSWTVVAFAPSKDSRKIRSGEEQGHEMLKMGGYSVLVAIFVLLVGYTYHCSWASAESYAAPSLLVTARGTSGTVLFDDFREAFYWIRQNTPDNTNIMSWFDHGDEIAALTNRTVLVDTNAWNHTHVASIARAFVSPEEQAHEFVRRVDVDYIVVVFGGLMGYGSDDINK
eukprot:gene3652-4081_t